MSQKRNRNRKCTMGNSSLRRSSRNKSPGRPKRMQQSVNDFKFHSPFPEEDSNNGLILNKVFLPEEIVVQILTQLNPEDALKATLVCKAWCNIVKSRRFWMEKYSTEFKNKHPKKLPWYVYYEMMSSNLFDRNLLKNTCGENNFQHWKIVKNYGDEFRIEDPPVGAEPLPVDVPDFNGHTSCFATSFYECDKYQSISFANNNLMQLIFNRFKPKIYASEWVSGRFDCGCSYKLSVKLLSTLNEYQPRDEELQTHKSVVFVNSTVINIAQWAGSTWQKAEINLSNDYPDGVLQIIFQHEGKDTQFWKGHYGSKMSGGVLKILFDSIEPQSDSDESL